MDFTQHCIDIAACREKDIAIHDVIERRQGDCWLVCAEPVRTNDRLVWQSSFKGEHLMIPLMPYLLPNTCVANLPFGMQLGVRVAAETGKRLRRLHIAYGSEFTQVAGQPDLLQQYVGFAILVER